VAKHTASVDVLSGGRLTLGVGIGWSAEEYAALGVPFRGRARRNREYVEAMRMLWRDDRSSYDGEDVRFEQVRCYPKPTLGAIPIVLGGNGARALERVARYGDGWYGFNLTLDELPERLEMLWSACRRYGRTAPSIRTAAFVSDATPSNLPGLAALGVSELVLVGSPPATADDASAWVEELAGRLGVNTRASP